LDDAGVNAGVNAGIKGVKLSNTQEKILKIIAKDNSISQAAIASGNRGRRLMAGIFQLSIEKKMVYARTLSPRRTVVF